MFTVTAYNETGTIVGFPSRTDFYDSADTIARNKIAGNDTIDHVVITDEYDEERARFESKYLTR